jgi:hypothetical protein
LEPGEKYISGDYEASTDNLHFDAVLAVVEVMAESLPEEKAKLLVSSFRDCWVDWKGEKRNIIRGSMMGNLGSFVVLCILNRICYQRARWLTHGPGSYSPCLINGDDILFKGCDGMYASWLHCTSEVGFVINRTKTMRSLIYGDLNSQTFCYRKGRKVKKLCFGFLGSESWKEPVDTLANPLFDLCKQVSFKTATYLLTCRPIRLLLRRSPIPLSSIPRRWWNFLVKKHWFRSCVDSSPSPVESSGTERKLPFVLGPPISTTPALEREIKAADEEVIRFYVNEWTGVPVSPIKERRPTVNEGLWKSPFRLRRRIGRWERLWLAPTLEAFTRFYYRFLVTGNDDWIDDQPGLQVGYRLVRQFRKPVSFAPPTNICIDDKGRDTTVLGEVVPENTIDGVVWRCV